MATSCGYCYKLSSALQRCGRCKKRCYCSKECQTADWKCGHKHWCGVAGELGIDFEIRDTGVPGRGMGVFALRDFQRNDKIMAERCAMTKRADGALDIIPPTEPVVAALMALAPADSVNIVDKFYLNIISCDGQSCVFVHMSRVNHACFGNSFHRFVDQHQIEILVANRFIAAGEEIHFSYIHNGSGDKSILTEKWGFTCRCAVCEDEQLASLVKEAGVLDNEIFELGRHGRVDEAIQKARRQVEVYGLLGVRYARPYFDLFTLNVMRQRTMEDAMRCLQTAYEIESETFSGCKDKTCGSLQKFRKLLEDPSQHSQYKILDKMGMF